MLACNNLSYAYNNNSKILDNINYNFNKATTYLLTGKSGSGKTTLIKCLAGLFSYTGKISIDNLIAKDLTNKEKSNLCGIVFQEYNLFPNLTILENCTKALKVVNKICPLKAKDNAIYWLEKLGLGKLTKRYPKELSGGQKQRAAIARSLAKNIKVLILDEPTAAIDQEAKLAFLDIINLLQEKGLTIIISSHDSFLIENLQNATNIKIENGELIQLN